MSQDTRVINVHQIYEPIMDAIAEKWFDLKGLVRDPGHCIRFAKLHKSQVIKMDLKHNSNENNIMITQQIQ